MLRAMWVVPLVASLIALGFAVLLGRQFIARRRAAQLLWALALLMYAVAALALFLGVRDAWSPAEYRLYWLFGAVLNVPYLAMGELYLLVKDRRVTTAALVALLFATAFAIARVRSAALDVGALAADLPQGKEAWAADPLALDLARYFAFPAYFFLLGGTAWSAWKMRGRSDLRDRFLGTLAVAIGATIVAAGSAFALTGNFVGFSITITLGIAVMFWGFLRASRPAVVPAPGT